MRRILIAANWKMNRPPEGWDTVISPYREHPDVDVVVFPTYLDLERLIKTGIRTGAQCGHEKESGAHTGCISMAMLKEIGCEAVLCGHSERRRDQRETHEDVIRQAKAALAAGLHAIVCIGETKEEREAGREKEVVFAQMQGLPKNITLAYEPVWAINSGNTATPEQAQEMQEFIRINLPADQQQATRILYGGSLSAGTAQAILSQHDIDGGLIGSASLKPDEFRAIVESAAGLRRP